MSLVKANGAGEVSTGFYNGVATQSARFDSNHYMTETPSSAGNRKQFTFSWWMKKHDDTGYSVLYSTAVSGTNSNSTLFHLYADNSNGRISAGGVDFAGYTVGYQRDVNNWYHCVVVVDTDQSSNNDRVKIYINGIQNSAMSGTCPQSNLAVNSTQTYHIGRRRINSDRYANIYLADFHLVDGTAISDTSRTNPATGATEYVIDEFGEFNNGVWIPKAYSGSYGTNGFRMEFKGTGTSADSSGIGADTSGNNHHHAVTNFTAADSNMLDSPENNFATLNRTIAVGQRSSATYSEGNLKYTSSDAYDTAISTIGVNSGKYYFESRFNSNGYQLIGLRQNPFTQKSTYIGQNSANSGIAYSRAISSVVNSTAGTTSSVGSASSGDIAQVAFDADNGYVWFGINNTYYGTVDSSTGRFTLDGFVSGKHLFPAVGYRDSQTLNFGQDGSFAGGLTGGDVGTATDDNGIGAFKYAPPSGYLALCSANLPELSISPAQTTQADDHFNTILWSGNSSYPRALTGVGFQPDWIWTKTRNQAYGHGWFDSSRGASAGAISSQNTINEPYAATNFDLDSFDSDGMTWASTADTSTSNNSGDNYVAWNWKANGGTTTTNDASSTGVGTIDSVFQANTTSGFSIVTYTGTGSAGTIKHGLSVAPSLVIIKSRSGGSVPNWVIGQDISGFTGQLYFDTGAFSTNSGSFNNTAPTTSVVSIGTDSTVNQNTINYVMYCFANVEGFSRVGSYIGNGNTDGTFVFTGFRPAFLLIKSTGSSTNGWYIYDNKRLNFGSLVDGQLYANLANAEDDGNRDLDFLSSGFKPRLTDTNVNASGTTFVYLAFAEQPFKFSNAK